MSAIGPQPTVEAQGARIPLLGLGTWELRGRVCARVVEQALRLGYRHIDTAEMYDNEREIGEGLHASGVKRNEVFITTKVWQTHLSPYDLELLMNEDLDIQVKEALLPSSTLAKTGDALPGLGIVAAVLGVVNTMGAIDGPASELGKKVGGAHGLGDGLVPKRGGARGE